LLNTALKIASEFIPISLKEIEDMKLMDRVDIKYIFNLEKLIPLLEKAKGKYFILEIEEKRIFSYKTTYLDTKDYSMYNAHHNNQINRHKIRFREYLDSALGFLEVKFKSNKERTIKKRIEQQDIEVFSNNEKMSQFVEKLTPFHYSDLEPKLITQFSRITLVHKKKSERVTIDLNIHYEDGKTFADLPYLVIVEVKQDKISYASDFIKILKEYKIRRTDISKYCIGTALLNNDIKKSHFKSKLLKLNQIKNETSCEVIDCQ